MHQYAISTNERSRVVVVLFVTSILLATGAMSVLQSATLRPAWWLGFPSIGGFYAALYFSFDRWLWRWRIVRALLGLTTPCIHGDWRGTVRPANGDLGETRTAELVIDQTWSHILVCSSTDNSKSRSVVASFSDEASSAPALTYIYKNEPLPHARETMNAHSGTACLELDRSLGKVELRGQYYTGRGRRSFGSLQFSRAQDCEG